MDHTLTLTDVNDDALRQAIAAPLVAYNDAQAGPGNSRALVIAVRDGAGAVVGGLWGWTSYEWLFTQLLVVPEALRGRGIGRDLMRRAEDEAVARGCRARLPRGVAGYLRVPGPRVLRAHRLRGLRRDRGLPARPRALLPAQALRMTGPAMKNAGRA